MSSLFSCGAMAPHARKSRRSGGGSDRPRGTIQRATGSAGTLRRGASSATRLCDLADKCENLTAGFASPLGGSRPPLSSLAVNSPPTCGPADETGRPDDFSLDGHKSAQPTPAPVPSPPTTPMAPPPAPPRHTGHVVLTPQARVLGGAEPVSVPQGHVVSGVKVCAACRAKLGAEGSGACFFAFDRSFCTEACQKRFIDMARAKAASRRQRTPSSNR